MKEKIDIKEQEFKDELDRQHLRLLNGEIETMTLEEFEKKYRDKFNLWE